MITYVTCDDVDNAFGNGWTSENAKNKAVLNQLSTILLRFMILYQGSYNDTR